MRAQSAGAWRVVMADLIPDERVDLDGVTTTEVTSLLTGLTMQEMDNVFMTNFISGYMDGLHG